MTGVVIVGTGFGCLTHLRALRSGRLRRARARRARPREDGRTRATLRRSATDSRTSPTRSRCPASTPSRSRPHRTRTRPIALEAIAAGKHVLCEKPFARDAAEARPMLDAAEAAGRRAPPRHRVPLGIRTGVDGARRRGAVRSARRSSRPSCCTSRCSPTPKARCPAWWADAAQGGGWLGAQAVARDRSGARDVRRVRGSERVAHPGLRARLGRRRQLHRALPHAFRCRRRHAEHESARGDRPCSSPASPATAAPCGPSSTPCGSPTPRAHARSPAPADLPARRAPDPPPRRPARPPPTTACTCSASDLPPVHAPVHDVPRPDRGPTPCPPIRRPRPSPTGSPACRCSTPSANRPAKGLGRAPSEADRTVVSRTSRDEGRSVAA